MFTDFWKQRQRIFRRECTAYMNGWDSVLTGKRSNPYRRRDFIERFDRGRKDCLDCKPLPYWYNDWRNKWKEDKQVTNDDPTHN